MYCLKNCDWNKLVLNNLTPNHKLRIIYIKDDDSEETVTFSNLESINVNNIKKIISKKEGHGKAWKNVTCYVNRLIVKEPLVVDDDDDNEVSQSKPEPIVVKKKPSLHRCLDFNTYYIKRRRYTNYVFNTKSLKNI